MAIAVALERLTAFTGAPLVIEPGWSFRLILVLTLTATAASLIWLSEAITRRQIGRGVTLLFFAGCAADLPGAASAIGAQLRAGYAGPGDLAMFAVGLVASSVLVVVVDPARWGLC